MSKMIRITGRVIAAARALVGVSQEHFAKASGLSVEKFNKLELSGSAWIKSSDDVEAISRGLDHYGVVIIEETDDMGAGVRLKFARSDVRDINRLEDEGGITGSDDAP